MRVRSQAGGRPVRVITAAPSNTDVRVVVVVVVGSSSARSVIMCRQGREVEVAIGQPVPRRLLQ